MREHGMTGGRRLLQRPPFSFWLVRHPPGSVNLATPPSHPSQMLKGLALPQLLTPSSGGLSQECLGCR